MKKISKEFLFLSKQEKGKNKQQYGCEHYESLSEYEKQELVEHKRNMELKKNNLEHFASF